MPLKTLNQWAEYVHLTVTPGKVSETTWRCPLCSKRFTSAVHGPAGASVAMAKREVMKHMQAAHGERVVPRHAGGLRPPGRVVAVPEHGLTRDSG